MPKAMAKKLYSFKIVRYGFIGGISTLIHFGIASAYLYFLSNSLLQANIAGFLVAYVFSYLAQSKHVFGHEISWIKAFRYFAVQFGSLLTSVGISSLLTDFNSYIKTVIVIFFMPLITYMVHKVWTFKD